MMTSNTYFTTPFPALADVTTATDALEASNEAAVDGGRQAMLTRNADKAVLVSLMRQLAAYVQSHANGSRAVVLSSGFTTTKVPGPIGPLSPPENLRLAPSGLSGQLILRMQRVIGITAGYTVQTAEAATGPYTDYTTTGKTRIAIEGLTPGKPYWVRACANGADGPSNCSNPVSAMAI